MKFNVLRSILIPWILFFVLSVAVLVTAGLFLPAQYHDWRFQFGVLAIGSLCCLLANMDTLNKAGIWVAYSLPYSVRHQSRNWTMRALFAIVTAISFWFAGEAPWMPLFWQGFVIPIVFAIAMFIFTRSVAGLILKKAAQVTFIRLFAILMNVPLILAVAVMSIFLSRNILKAYEASQPEISRKMALAEMPAKPAGTAAKPVVAAADALAKPKLPEAIARRIQELKELSEAGQPCPEQNKEIRASMDPGNHEEVAYWATQALHCSDMKSAVVLPRLADLMLKHKSPKVRAAAIRAMAKYNSEAVRPIAYLLLKRINEHENAEVLQAAAMVLAKLGKTEKDMATNRFKNLLDSTIALQAATILIGELQREDVVSNYIVDHLNTPSDSRARAIDMICLLPASARTATEPFVSSITAAIQKPVPADPAMRALACMGPVGSQAIRQEVVQPQKMNRPAAARAFAEMDLKGDPEALKTAEGCLADVDEQVRKSCSESMGKVGRIALPKIMDLLQSNDSAQREAGKEALESFNDPLAKDELRRVRAENSGWMATQSKLQMANAVSGALKRIESEEPPSAKRE